MDLCVLENKGWFELNIVLVLVLFIGILVNLMWMFLGYGFELFCFGMIFMLFLYERVFLIVLV